jgi:hypothetical protein
MVGESINNRWPRWWLVALSLILIVSGGLVLGRGFQARPGVAAAPTFVAAAPTSTAPTSTAPIGKPSPSRSAKPPVESGVLQLAGAVPSSGSGSFRYATRRGKVVGTGGPLRRYRVAVEKGSNEDPEAFADQVEATLSDQRSWIGGGKLRLQLVGGSDPAEFTVHLATRTTAGEMCLRGGTNIRIGGVPYTSCRTTGKAIINLDRWRLSSRPYLRAKIPLATYRRYVINHEVGHELGHHHETCPKAGTKAPVMVQQTITLRGCVAYPWPRLGDHFLTGPPI